MFYVGQKVICVNDMHQYGPYPCVVKDEIYTIRGFRRSTGGVYVAGIFLQVYSGGEEQGFLRFRFMGIDDGFADEILEKIKPEIEVEEICN